MSLQVETITAIAEFLRDAQTRYAELSHEVADRRNRKITEIKDKRKMQIELMVFINLLYVERYNMPDSGFTFSNWTDVQIIERIEYFRTALNMNIIAGASFTGFTPNIFVSVESLGGGAANDIQAGQIGDNAVYSGTKEISGEAKQTIFGFNDEPIDNYFQ